MSLSRILMIITESLANQVVRSQALRHAAVMRALDVAEFEILALGLGPEMHEANRAALREAREEARCGVTLVEGMRPARPGGSRANRAGLLAARDVLPGRFDAIHARTDYAALIASPLAAALGIPLIWDCRGDAVAETAYAAGGPASMIRRVVLRRRQIRVARQADRAIFVSRPLRELLSPPWTAGKRSIIAPCAAEGSRFGPDPAAREATRARLGIDPSAPLLLYSGGLAAYQLLPETIAHFRALRATRPEARLLLLTPEREAARRLAGDDPAILVESAPNERVNAYLNAADAAYLLRRDDRTNRVASPTKFAEYGLAGLPVIMSRAVEDCAAAADAAGSRIDPGAGWEALAGIRRSRSEIAAWFQARYTREGQAETYRGIYAP